MKRLSAKSLTLALIASLSLVGCGWHLRGSEDQSFAININVQGPGTASAGNFVGAFGTALTGSGGAIVPNAYTARGIIYLYQAVYRRQSITLSRIGQSTGFDLSYRVVYEVRSPIGEVLQPRKEFEIKRDYFNDQSLPLAQLYEETKIREEVEKEAAQSLLRRVVNVLRNTPEDKLQPPPPPATPPEKPKS